MAIHDLRVGSKEQSLETLSRAMSLHRAERC